jgi:hypothetical protein
MAGQWRASRCSGGVFRTIARSMKLPGSAGTRPTSMTCPRAPSRSTSFSATCGVGAVGCSSGAPNGLLLNKPDGRLLQCALVAPGERARVVPPASDVDRAAEDDRAVTREVIDR